MGTDLLLQLIFICLVIIICEISKLGVGKIKDSKFRLNQSF